jgi:hypothetical protein
MSEGTTLHPPWCARDCTGAITSVHASGPVPVAPQGAELIGITVHLEQLVETPPVTMLVIEFVQDDEPVAYPLPIHQARALQFAIRSTLRRLASVT